MTMTNYPTGREYAAKYPDRCPVVTATASGNGVRVCKEPLVDGVCPCHGLVKEPMDAMQEVEEEVEP